jgi:hypothetical protein
MRAKIFILFLLFSFELYCQTIKPDILASSGGSGNNEQISMSWTLGETFIDEYVTNDFALSQGFHQHPLRITTNTDETDQLIKMTAYPNPVNDILTILITSDQKYARWEIEVFDARGRLITIRNSEKTSFEIDFSSFISGVYLVRVSNKDFTKVFHIIKNAFSHEKN